MERSFRKIKQHQHICPRQLKYLRYALCDQKARPSPELSPITAAVAGGSTGAEEDVTWQELVPWLEQLPVGEMVRLRNNMSMEGSKGLRRLTGQKAEPP